MRKIQITENEKIIVSHVAENWDEVSYAAFEFYAIYVFLKRKELFSVQPSPSTTLGERDELKAEVPFDSAQGTANNILINDSDRFDYARICLLAIMCGIDFPTLMKIGVDQVSGMLNDFKLVDFFFEKNTRTKAPLKHINIGKLDLRSPKNGLSGSSILEYSFAEGYYLAYAKTGDIEHLYLLFGTLYRERKINLPKRELNNSEFDQRILFNKNSIEYYSEALKGISEDKELLLEKGITDIKGFLICVWLYFDGCRNVVIERFKNVFESKSTHPNPSQEGTLGTNWLEVILAKSGGKFGDFNSTEDTDFYVFFAELNRETKEVENLKKMYEKS